MHRKEIKQHIIYLEIQRMCYSPFRYIKKFVKNTDDIYLMRNMLKSISFDHKSIEYIVSLIVDALKEDKRFKRIECLKVLKKIIKSRALNEPFSRSLMNDLFYIYRSYIFCSNEEIQWAVSIFIKDQHLENEDIQWLIDNYKESDHIVNRLLRYPKFNKLIFDWAKLVYEEGSLNNRLSEVIGILINDDIPKYIKVDIDVIMWAIYYSKCPKAKKEELILKYLDYQNYSSSLEVAERLGLGSVSSELLEYYKDLLKSYHLQIQYHKRTAV